MSATMEEQEFAYYFRSIPRDSTNKYLLAPVLKVDKRLSYETNIYYNDQFAKTDLVYDINDPCITPEQYEIARKLISIFDKIEKNNEDNVGEETKAGSVLVFLPGLHEIDTMAKILETQRTSPLLYDIIPLHSSLTSEQMVKVFQKPKEGTRKIILSTNIAESSLTVPDAKYVIDFCLTKIMTINESTKFSTLSLQWASRSNCKQRAGRVGRVASGRVYRLVPYEFYKNHMLENTLPELQRAPLENIILYMKLLNLNDTPKNVLALAISPPNLKDVESCIWQLKEVGALLLTRGDRKTSADGDITFLGQVMGSLPIDIRFSKLIILGHMFSCLEEAVIIAAGCMTRNVFIQNMHERYKCYRKKLLWADNSCSDFMILLNLYNVWLSNKRQHNFRNPADEIAWCKKNYVNLKGLREWEILIKEINSRLKNFGIETPMGAGRVNLSTSEKPTVLKIIICGAFYPNYFIRSADFGQVDSREAVKVLNGRDPYNTVYFTNMKLNQPGKIYVRPIKQLLKVDPNNQNVKVGFDGQSSKVFVEFKNVKHPEEITVDGRQYISTIPGKISEDVYEAVRKRQLNIPFRLRVLPDHKAWEFAERTDEKQKKAKEETEEVNCYSSIDYSPLPTLDLQYITVIVTEVVDAGFFYCQNWNDETRFLLEEIYTALNGPGVFLDPVGDKIEVLGKLYAARFDQDNKFYRCKVMRLTPGNPAYAHVQFVDYGNNQKVPANLLYELPTVSRSCFVQPIAMPCVLSEVHPDPISNPSGIWNERVNSVFKRKTQQVLLNAKVYSVVDGVVHLELFSQNSNTISFNQWLINEGYAQKFEETPISKMDHETRQKVLTSEDPNNMSAILKKVTTAQNYTDFEAPSTSEATEIVDLKGPFSPLEMRVCGLIQSAVGSLVKVEGDSVNAVLLDDNPEDPHARLLVAATVTQSTGGKVIKIAQTTLMPSLPGLPMLMTLLFCPQMEPKLTEDGSRVASILCGMGYKEFNDKANFPMHDLVFSLDTELNKDIISKVDLLRVEMNQAIKIMENIHNGISFPSDLSDVQKHLKEFLFQLLHMKQKSVERVDVKYSNIWNKHVCEKLDIIRAEIPEQPNDIWRLLWFVELNENKFANKSIEENLEELTLIAKRLAPEKEIVCTLCGSSPLRTIADIRIHLFKNEHKRNLAARKS